MGLLIYIVTIVVFTFIGGCCVAAYHKDEGYRQIEYKDNKLVIYFENEAEIQEFESICPGAITIDLRNQKHNY